MTIVEREQIMPLPDDSAADLLDMDLKSARRQVWTRVTASGLNGLKAKQVTREAMAIITQHHACMAETQTSLRSLAPSLKALSQILLAGVFEDQAPKETEDDGCGSGTPGNGYLM